VRILSMAASRIMNIPNPMLREATLRGVGSYFIRILIFRIRRLSGAFWRARLLRRLTLNFYPYIIKRLQFHNVRKHSCFTNWKRKSIRSRRKHSLHRLISSRASHVQHWRYSCTIYIQRILLLELCVNKSAALLTE